MKNKLRNKALFVLGSEGFDEGADEVIKLLDASDAKMKPLELNETLIHQAIGLLFNEGFDEAAEFITQKYEPFKTRDSHSRP